MTPAPRGRRWTTVLGVAGAVCGLAAGTIQATMGEQIPQWSGDKDSPVALGLLTIGLSLLAGVAAVAQRRSHSVRGRAGLALAMVGPGLLCLSAVGRLWYPPALLLVTAGLLTVDDWRATGRMLVADRYRVLLSALGGCELVMAAGATTPVMVVGAVGGLLLVVAPWLGSTSRPVLIGMIVLGVVPFAVLAWTALVPVLLAQATAVVAIPVVRDARPRRRRPARPSARPVVESPGVQVG